MRKITALFAMLLMLLFIAGCNSSNIIEENGEYFLVIPQLDQYEPTYENSFTLDINFIAFESVDEMLSKIKQADFTEEDLKIISSRFHKDSQGRIRLFDISNIYVPVCPEGLEIKYVLWEEGNRYSYSIQDPTGQQESVHIRWLSEESYLNQVQTYSARSGYVSNTLKSEDTTMNIFIHYVHFEWGDYITSMTIFVKQQDLHFQLSMSGVDEYPSEDWLLKFSMKPYK